MEALFSLNITELFRHYRNIDSNELGSLESAVKYLEVHDRITFFSIYLVLLVIAVIANLAAIVVTIKRKHRFLQKSCIISLSISDLITAIIYCVNNMETFSHPLVNWTLGDFMCHFVPTVQILGITASTAAIVAIALDRYRNVVHAMTKRWNPTKKTCVFGFVVLWIICACISSPIYTMFDLKRAFIIFLDPNTNKPLRYEAMHFCVSLDKKSLKNYYIVMAVVVFATLFVIFIWLYVTIARLVWKHRKPPCYPDKNLENSAVETSVTQLKSIDAAPPKIINKSKIGVERKIRTFRIIVFLMLVFFLCRMPFWIFNIAKLVEKYNEHRHWIMTYIFNALALLNCALNPFLYTFLNHTLKVTALIRRTILDFIGKVCCCCFNTAEFEDFERDNPFAETFRNRVTLQKVNEDYHPRY